jgi:diguanylate cyclase (GGDEF)-like protein
VGLRFVLVEPLGEAARREIERIDGGSFVVEVSLSREVVAALRAAGADAAALRGEPRFTEMDRSFDMRLENEYLRAVRYRHPLSLVLLSVDRAETLAEAHGEEALSGLLENLREIFRRSVRVVDMVFRTGRFEMAILMPETALSGARTVADRLRQQTSRLLYKPPGDDFRTHLPFKATASVGVVDAPCEGIGSSEEFLDAARLAVSRARDHGGDRTEEPAA